MTSLAQGSPSQPKAGLISLLSVVFVLGKSKYFLFLLSSKGGRAKLAATREQGLPSSEGSDRSFPLSCLPSGHGPPPPRANLQAPAVSWDPNSGFCIRLFEKRLPRVYPPLWIFSLPGHNRSPPALLKPPLHTGSCCSGVLLPGPFLYTRRCKGLDKEVIPPLLTFQLFLFLLPVPHPPAPRASTTFSLPHSRKGQSPSSPPASTEGQSFLLQASRELRLALQGPATDGNKQLVV